MTLKTFTYIINRERLKEIGEKQVAKISEGMQGLMNDFLEAKRSFYGWDDETFRQKSENFHANVRKVKFRPQYHDVDHIGRYNCKNGTVVLDMEGTDVGSFHARGIAHELNHAFNYEKGKRMNLLDGKNLRKSAKKYNLLSEIINEAEAQVLFAREYSQALGKEIPEQFSSYRDLEPIFKTLCICTNQDAVGFLGNIEGKGLDEFVDYFAEASGHTKDEAWEYIDSISDQMNGILEQGKKIKDISELENVTQYQTIYDMSASYITTSSLDDISRQEMTERLISIQPEVIEKVLEGVTDIKLKRQLANEIKLVDYPQIEDGAKFEWGETKGGIKMAQRYIGLDFKKRKLSPQQLLIGNSSPNVRSNPFSQQLSELKSSTRTYSRERMQSNVTPQAPTMFESMPDLTQINSDEEMARSYMKIETLSKSEPTRTVQMPSQSYSAPTR